LNAEERRPQSAAPSDMTTAAVEPSIRPRTDRNAAARYDSLVKLIAHAHCKHCVGLGWALRDADLELEQARELGRAGDQVLAGGNPQLRWPTHAEYEQRRQTLRDCNCGGCSTCIRAAAIEKNRERYGSDNYPGSA